ncbi:hypothetical protein AB1Y20_007877 [Prymnesium parvum]|uniref:Uncharacterized protein n=1 Tax=Prymnesium parvum TaxID=97485 RepID=A0AB34ITE0_PRYPA
MEQPAAPPRDAALSASAAALSASRARLASLCAASSRLAAARRTQAEREREIQAVCNAVWTVTPQQYSVSGKCGERQQFSVSHTYTQPVATIDGGKYAALRQAMAAHLEYTRSALASAHFDHALCQLHLVLAVQAEVFAGRRSLEAEETYSLLQAVVGRLASAEVREPALKSRARPPPLESPRRRAQAPCDEHTRPFLRHLALLLGAEFLAAAGEAAADAARTARLLHLLYTGRGCGWAAPLLQPAVGAVVSTRWVWHALVNGPALHGALPAEDDLAAFLSQVDWRQLGALEPTDVSAFVVQPIQRVLRRLCESEQVASLLLLGKILTAAVQAHPSLAVAALTAITRSTVRTALRCAPLLVLWQWHLSPPETLWTAWCEIYRVSATRLDDFAQRHPLQQQAQQKEFVTFQLSDAAAAASVYAAEPRLASVNDKLHFPMVACLRRLALHAAFPRDGAVPPEPRLARLCARELLAIAVMDVPHEGGPVLQLEAAASLSTLCQQIPELISAVVEEVVLQLPHLTASTRGHEHVRSLLDALPFDGWRVELPQLDSLCSLLTASSLSFTHHSPSTPHAGLSTHAAALLSTATTAPALPPPHGAITRRHVEIALAPPSAPPAAHEAPLASLRAKVGCALFERVDWHRVDAACRERGLLLLAACRARVPPSWWWGQLLGAAGAALVATEPSAHVFDGLMHAVPADAEPIAGALGAMQSMLVVAAAQRAIAAGGHASLLEMGMQYSLWQRLGQLVDVAQHTALRHLLEKVLAVLVVAPADVPSPLPPLLSSYMAVAPSHAEALRMMMLNSLAQADDQSHHRWITLWASLLAPLVATDAAAASLLDTLIHCVFAAAHTTIADSPIPAALLSCQLARRQVLGFLSGKKVWLALAAALAYMPQLPSDAPVEDALRISSTQPLDARMRSSHGSMLPRRAFGEEMKTGFLSTHEGRRAASHSLSDATAWGVGGPSPTAALSCEATEYASMSGGGRDGTHASREALSHCALGILFEAAVSLERDVRALLFWERFFVLYFSAHHLEPGFFPPARQAEANDHFGRMARSFEPSDRRVYMLYECFTTWSEEIIPRRGAFFTPDAVHSEGYEHFISIITAAYPPPYFRSRESSAASLDGNDALDASGLGQELALTSLQPLQITMHPSSDQAVPPDVCSDPRATRADLATPPDAPAEARSKEVLHQMLPTPAPLPSTDAIASELRREERALQERLAKARAVLADRIKRQAASGSADSAPPEDDDDVALWDELSAASNEYRNSILSVRRVDAEYLSLIRQLNVNQSSGESKQVLVRHPECEQPVMFVVPQIKVVPGPAYVRERLQANREEFLSYHRSLQRLTHTFAAYAALLELVARDIQLDFSFQQENGSSGHPSSESVANGREQSLEMPAGAIELFFMLLPVPLGYALPPTISRLCEALTGLVAEIGETEPRTQTDLPMH